MVECTGLENRQSRKALVGSNPTASARALVLAVAALVCVTTGGCNFLRHSVPGETLTSGTKQRAVQDRVLEQAARDNPGCRQQKVTDTVILDLHPDAKAAVERWTVTGCGEKMNYLVRFPPTNRGTGFLVNADR